MASYRVVNFNELESTNEYVKEAIESGEAEGLVCRSRVQTGGYGRQGRLWTSPAGGLYQSLLLRPQVAVAKLPTLGLVVGLSIRAALVELGGLSPWNIMLKWPNDIMADDGKLAGISMEAHAGGICAGIGVNVFHPSEELLADGKYHPAFFSDIAFGFTEVGAIEFADGEPYENQQAAIAAVGDAILAEFGKRYPIWQEQGFDAFSAEYRSCSYLLGKRVRMALVSGQVLAEGIAVGVDSHGCLLVDDGSQVRAVSAGEAHIL